MNSWRQDFEEAKNEPEVELLVAGSAGSRLIVLAKYGPCGLTGDEWVWARTEPPLQFFTRYTDQKKHKANAHPIAWRKVDPANWEEPKPGKPTVGDMVRVYPSKIAQRDRKSARNITTIGTIEAVHSNGTITVLVDIRGADAGFGTWRLTCEWVQCEPIYDLETP